VDRRQGNWEGSVHYPRRQRRLLSVRYHCTGWRLFGIRDHVERHYEYLDCIERCNYIRGIFANRSFPLLKFTIDSIEVLILRRRHNVVELHCIVSQRSVLPNTRLHLCCCVSQVRNDTGRTVQRAVRKSGAPPVPFDLPDNKNKYIMICGTASRVR
jgi:hypothetical protein